MAGAQFKEAMEQAGYLFDGEPIPDGNIQRFPHEDRNGGRSGWYILYGDGVPAGSFGDWRSGQVHVWSEKNETDFTPDERAQFRQRIEEQKKARSEEKQREYDAAALRAKALWEESTPAAEDHPYLLKKKVKAHGVREDKTGRLVIPIRDPEGKLTSVQTIDPTGEKRFLSGGKKRGCCFAITGKSPEFFILAEGFATGATINEATGETVIVCLDAGNLLPVGEELRKKHPQARIVICADNDQWTDGNPGLTKATEAGKKIDASVLFPSFKNTSTKPTDFNDLASLEGLAEVRTQIEKAIKINGGPTACVVLASELTPEPVKWLWPGFLARGKVHIFAGAAGVGKTRISVSLGAVLTRGGRWPDGTRAPLGAIAIWSGEDDPADTILPRLIADGADLRRVHIIKGVREGNEKRNFDPATDIQTLEPVFEKHEICLLIVDPVVSAVAGDSHKNAEVRRSLQPLVDLAEKFKCAALGITHFSKNTRSKDPLERVTGSLAFGALARMVWAAIRKPEEEDGSRVFARIKSNIGPDGGGFKYFLEPTTLEGFPGIVTTALRWGDPLEGTAQEIFNTVEADEEERSATDEAVDWLYESLSDGPKPAREIEKEAGKIGFTRKIIYSAKQKLKVKSCRVSNRWQWSIQNPMDNQDTLKIPKHNGRESCPRDNTQYINIINNNSRYPQDSLEGQGNLKNGQDSQDSLVLCRGSSLGEGILPGNSDAWEEKI
jgi:putative DNA primase/helicase